MEVAKNIVQYYVMHAIELLLSELDEKLEEIDHANICLMESRFF